MHVKKFLALSLLCVSCGLSAASLNGKVVGVADGDTITVLDSHNIQHKIRLQGIDAPEKAQAYGQKSKQSLYQMVHGKFVSVEFEKKDKYGRTVGKVSLNGTDICLEQIKLGMAWHYKQYESEQSAEDRAMYEQAEQSARTQNLGLWKDNKSIPPWEFRRNNK